MRIIDPLIAGRAFKKDIVEFFYFHDFLNIDRNVSLDTVGEALDLSQVNI